MADAAPAPAVGFNADMEAIDAIVAFLRTRTDMVPLIGIVCGSGLSTITALLANPVDIPYAEIPGFPVAHVQGHGNSLVFGDFDGVPVVCMKGRFHFYSGYTMQQVVIGVRVMAVLGAQRMIVTNAAGAINTQYNVGDVMVMSDHVNIPGLCGMNPLLGTNVDRLGPRFPPMSDVYDPDMQKIVLDVAAHLGHAAWFRRGGVYAAVLGPQYETPAECRFLRMLGGDAVGMSTIPEVLAARHAGMKVLGLSLISNKVVSDPKDPVATHAEVLEAVNMRVQSLPQVVRDVVVRFAALDRERQSQQQQQAAAPAGDAGGGAEAKEADGAAAAAPAQ